MFQQLTRVFSGHILLPVPTNHLTSQSSACPPSHRRGCFPRVFSRSTNASAPKGASRQRDEPRVTDLPDYGRVCVRWVAIRIGAMSTVETNGLGPLRGPNRYRAEDTTGGW